MSDDLLDNEDAFERAFDGAVGIIRCAQYAVSKGLDQTCTADDVVRALEAAMPLMDMAHASFHSVVAATKAQRKLIRGSD